MSSHQSHSLVSLAEATRDLWHHDLELTRKSGEALLEALNDLQLGMRAHERPPADEPIGETVSMAPRLEHEAGLVLKRHHALTRMLDRIVLDYVSASRAVEQFAAALEEFSRFCSALKGEQKAEESLLVEALDRELGAGD